MSGRGDTRTRLTRRAFLQGATTLAASTAMAGFAPDAVARALAAAPRVARRTPEETAQDETYWRAIQQAFTLDRTIVNLDNGAIGSSPALVHDACLRYLDVSNQAPVHYMWVVLEPNVETVRRRLAAEFGCDPEELAITRGATEALQIAQLGTDLARGDEVVTTGQDHERMLATWAQRERRDGIRVTTIPVPIDATDPADLRRLFERAITPRTKVLHLCHMTHRTGLIFPVRDICRMARARGIQTIVDGAQAVAQIPVAIADLGCDYYGASLHKFLLAPVGTGFLFVRRANIAKLWPLQPPPARLARDIRKFEQVGTHPAAAHNAVAEALAFHQAIGIERTTARLHYLKNRWAERLRQQPRVRILTSLDQPGGLAALSVEGFDAAALASRLWQPHRILVAPIVHAECEGIRVTPGVYTTLHEIDAFVEAVEELVN